MRLMTKEELVAVSGGEGKIYDPFNEDSDWDFMPWANGFGLFDLEFGNGTGKGKKNVPDNEMEKVIKEIRDSLPSGEIKIEAKVIGDKNGVTSWELTITGTMSSKGGKK